MFTGIIETTGEIEVIAPHRLGITCRLEKVRPGDSIAVNGICLTVTSIVAREADLATLYFDYSPETAERTSLAAAKKGGRVNLERALQLNGRLGGHIVTGHVEATAVLLRAAIQGDFTVLCFSLPAALARYVVAKGSIAVDGISLTVAGVLPDSFTVAVIPFTMQSTTLRDRKAGDTVNLEPDILAKYVEKLSSGSARKEAITESFLRENGF